MVALSITTSRCGSVTLMGLGLSIIGLLMTGFLTSVGQVWISHENLQNALDNAVMAMQAANNSSSTTLASLVETDGGFQTVTVDSLNSGSTALQAVVSTPVNFWFWAQWMGPSPVQVIAQA
ncbi:MAG: hypothetical protein C7B45_14945 [Sulfobacillus acidophilus]|uniref:Putative Flp pilus-assembly TadG-like N-terminal domain-containing protein n=1 Tax=Sulfobacillus acidophilus TaxID=53633 RepID=A0A2T2WDW6_9FIRM|nr:MAG: hypothetical protein C7B45_14945 [Sulfobacillus acidophilus]